MRPTFNVIVASHVCSIYNRQPQSHQTGEARRPCGPDPGGIPRRRDIVLQMNPGQLRYSRTMQVLPSSSGLDLPVLGIHLDARAVGLKHQYPALRIDIHRNGMLEILFPLQPPGSLPLVPHIVVGVQLGDTPLGQGALPQEGVEVVATSVEHLQPIVAPVGDVDIPVLIDSDIAGSMELTIAIAGATELHHEVSLRAELLNPVVAPVGNVYMVIGVYLYAPGEVELAIAAAKAAPLGQESAVLGELLNAVIGPVHHQQVVLAVEGDPRRPVELAVAGAFCTPLAQVVPITSPDGDAIEPLVTEVYSIIAVNGEATGPEDLAIAQTASGELAHELFIDRADGNAFQLDPVLVGAVGNVHQTRPGVDHQGHRVAEPLTGLFAAPDGMAIGQGRRFGLRAGSALQLRQTLSWRSPVIVVENHALCALGAHPLPHFLVWTWAAFHEPHRHRAIERYTSMLSVSLCRCGSWWMWPRGEAGLASRRTGRVARRTHSRWPWSPDPSTVPGWWHTGT